MTAPNTKKNKTANEERPPAKGGKAPGMAITVDYER